MKRHALQQLGLLICLLVFCVDANAFPFTPVGNPIEGNSWFQRWRWEGEAIDKIDGCVTGGFNTFKGNGLEEFNQHDWSSSLEDSKHGHATGTHSHDGFEFLTHFTGDHVDEISLDWTFWSGDNIIFSKKLHWTGEKWFECDHHGTSCDCLHEHNGVSSPVPEPATFFLLSFGLGGLVLKKRKKS